MESKNGGKVVRREAPSWKTGSVTLLFFLFFFQPIESLTKISFPIDSLFRGHREEIRVRARKGERETLALASSRLFAFSPKAKPLLYQPVRAKMTTNLLSFLLCGHPSKNPFRAGNDISLSLLKDVFLTFHYSSNRYFPLIDKKQLKQFTKRREEKPKFDDLTQPTSLTTQFLGRDPTKKVDRDNIVTGFLVTAIVPCIWWSKGCTAITTRFRPSIRNGGLATPFEKVYLTTS